jgi:KDO2-lipid IV(A) lauroyltransferase
MSDQDWIDRLASQYGAKQAAALPKKGKTWRIEGPFDSSYSLALVNRETARAMAGQGWQVALHSTEGPGDFPANPEVLAEALKGGQGVYILCTHTGNFEVMAASLSQTFAKMTSPVKSVGKNPGINRFISENRARQGIEAIVRKKRGEGFFAIRRALQENRLVGFMMDQARPGEPRVELFGKSAKTNTSLGAIWERCPAPLVPAYAERIGFARHIVHILPVVSFPPKVDRETDILNRARACNTIVEDIVKRCPEQYWWIHDRWK